MSKYVVLIIGLALVQCGQSDDLDEGVLVQVDDVEISRYDLLQFIAGLPNPLKPAKVDEATIKEFLGSLVDRQIMVLEGEAKGYKTDSDVTGRLHKLLAKRLVDRILKEQIGDQIQIAEEDIYQVYKEYGWGRQIRPAHILSHTEEEAWEIVKALKQGADFAELARQRSRSAKDAEYGGDLRQYFGPDDAATILAETVFDLPVGGFSDPIRTRDGYEVVKILEEQEISLASVRNKIGRFLHLKQFVEKRNRYLEELEGKFGLQYHDEGIVALLQAGAKGDPLSAEAKKLSLVGFPREQAISTGHGAGVLKRTGRPLSSLKDSLDVVRALRARLMVDSLLVREARERGLDKEEDFLAYKENTYQKILVGLVRKREVLEKIVVDDEEVKIQYKRDKDKYTLPARASLSEILVDSQELAQQLAGQINNGADMALLAREYSLRSEAKKQDGHFHLTEGEKEKWGLLFNQFMAAELNVLIGPVKTEDGFSLFRVEERVERKMRLLEEVGYIVRHTIKKKKENQAFEDYIRALRQKYQDRVQWYDDRIAAVGPLVTSVN
ncbi:MAG: hypothetical protein GKR89_21285 [Candidatus Latescibacteria bacterium]|nr:hypothetical protein [Candidatus Latescibacterota bacterium]